MLVIGLTKLASMHNIRIAAEIAAETGVPLDRLPYTDDFDEVHTLFVDRLGRSCSKSETWLSLIGARKRGLVGPRRRSHQNKDK